MKHWRGVKEGGGEAKGRGRGGRRERSDAGMECREVPANQQRLDSRQMCTAYTCELLQSY